MRRVLVASWVPRYNRQGSDLCEAVVRAGDLVRLWQVKPKALEGGRLSILRQLAESARFMLWAVCGRYDIVILIGKPALRLATFSKRFLRLRVIYYSLEYSRLDTREKTALLSCVDGVLDVEENRLSQFVADNSIMAPGFVVNNMPHLHTKPEGGKLKYALFKQFGISWDKRIAIYAGSYQKYARLENLIAAAARMKDECVFVFMMYSMPHGLQEGLPDNVRVIPPVCGDEFYSWLADADCSLLPYETEDDFNVRYCSPQKLFDCYLAGVPYLASKRPLIEKTLQMEPQAGAVCSFDEVEEIVSGIRSLFRRDRAQVRESMRRLHEQKLNYGAVEKDVLRFCYS